MKKLTKNFLMVIVSILTITLLVGCGGPKVPANESAEILLDILLKADNSRISDINLTQEQYEEVRKSIESSIVKTPDGAQFNELEDTMQVLTEAIFEGLNKVEYETALVSEDKETSTVELKIKGFDMDRINAELIPLVEEYYAENPTITQNEILEYVLQQQAQFLKEGYIKNTPDTLTYTFTKQDNVWLPEDGDFLTKVQEIIIPEQ